MSRSKSQPVADYITVSQAAAMLGMSRQRVNQLVQAGRLNSYHVGPKAVLVERRSVEARVLDERAQVAGRRGWHRGKRVKR